MCNGCETSLRFEALRREVLDILEWGERTDAEDNREWEDVTREAWRIVHE